MNFDHTHYVPCLRWKQGEYQAVMELSAGAREGITPLIEVPEIGWDFETNSYSKNIDEHLESFPKRVAQKWGHPCFVDFLHLPAGQLLANGQHPVTHVSEELRTRKCPAAIVTGLGRDPAYQDATKEVVSKHHSGICIRITLEEAADPTLKTSLDHLLGRLGVKPEACNFVLDLGAPNFEPISGFTRLVLGLLGRLPYREEWQTLSIIGTSFPSTMGEVKTGSTILHRWEWVLFKQVATELIEQGSRVPTFGDYGINHKDVSQMDMRKVKPAATIRYTAGDDWFIVKGRNVRDHKFPQYRGHCRTVMASPHFRGPAFSYGDAYIEGCAQGKEGTGNLSTWRKVGTNHHLEVVVQDLAKFFGT